MADKKKTRAMSAKRASLLTTAALLFARVALGAEMRCENADWQIPRYVSCDRGFALVGNGSAHEGFDQDGNAVYSIRAWAYYNCGEANDDVKNLIHRSELRTPYTCEHPRKKSTCVTSSLHKDDYHKGIYSSRHISDDCPAFDLKKIQRTGQYVLVRTIKDHWDFGWPLKSQFALAECTRGR